MEPHQSLQLLLQVDTAEFVTPTQQDHALVQGVGTFSNNITTRQLLYSARIILL